MKKLEGFSIDGSNFLRKRNTGSQIGCERNIEFSFATKYLLSLTGDTINVASRMESTGEGKHSIWMLIAYITLDFSHKTYVYHWTHHEIVRSNENPRFGEHKSSVGSARRLHLGEERQHWNQGKVSQVLFNDDKQSDRAHILGEGKHGDFLVVRTWEASIHREPFAASSRRGFRFRLRTRIPANHLKL